MTEKMTEKKKLTPEIAAFIVDLLKKASARPWKHDIETHGRPEDVSIWSSEIKQEDFVANVCHDPANIDNIAFDLSHDNAKLLVLLANHGEELVEAFMEAAEIREKAYRLVMQNGELLMLFHDMKRAKPGSLMCQENLLSRCGDCWQCRVARALGE